MAVWLWPGFKGQKGCTMVSIELVHDFDEDHACRVCKAMQAFPDMLLHADGSLTLASNVKRVAISNLSINILLGTSLYNIELASDVAKKRKLQPVCKIILFIIIPFGQTWTVHQFNIDSGIQMHD